MNIIYRDFIFCIYFRYNGNKMSIILLFLLVLIKLWKFKFTEFILVFREIFIEFCGFLLIALKSYY